MDFRGASLSWSDSGLGITVVLIHGFAETGEVWKYQKPVLEQHCRLIIPDLPGSGSSGALTGEEISIDDYADCIEAILKQEGIEAAVMLGHSMGGYVTLSYAERYPHRLRKFGLIHSTAYADSAEKKLSRQKGMEAIGKYGSRSFLKNTTPNLFSASFKQQKTYEVEALIEDGAKIHPATLQQYYRAMMKRPDRSHVLSGNRLPVLFVTGTEDVAAPMADVLQQSSLPDISYIHVLQDTGHMGMWEAPDKVNGFVLAFIKP